MTYDELEKGMSLFRDRIEDIWGKNDYFAYLENIVITDVEEDKKYFTRQSIYVYGDERGEDEMGKKFMANCSSMGEIGITKEQWHRGWADVELYSEEEVMRKIIKYAFS